MATAKFLSYVLPILISCVHLRGQENRVILNQGDIIGLKVFPEISSSPVYVFLGIPYAQAPIGDNRFKHSKPHSGWNQTLFARNFKPLCPQPSNSIYDETGDGMLKRPVEMDENCLYLNIWMPEISIRQGNLPVLVIITGEEMTFDWPQNRPNGLDLSSEGIVVVTVQYRSNIFGWLSLQSEDLPGNFGLHDQELALKWIQQNIHKFGGNPKQVTLLGHGTTGATCAFIHLISPKSAALFSKAIIMSSSALSYKSFADQTPSQEIISKLGCLSENTPEILHCLQQKSMDDLQQAFETIYNNGNYSTMLGPMPDTYRQPQDRYLPTDPRSALKNGQYRSIPTLLGITTNEGAFIRDYWIDLAREGYKSLQKYIESTVLPHILQKYLYIGASNQNQVLEAITWRFFGQYPESPSYLLNSLQRLISEIEFESPFFDTIELLANARNRANLTKTDTAETFLYAFHQPNSMDMRGKLNLFGGSGHSSDLPLVMGPSLFQQISRRRFTSAEDKLCRQLRKFFTDFMKTGSPTPGRIYDAWYSYTSDRKFIKTLGEYIETEGGGGSATSQFERNLPIIEEMLQKSVVGSAATSVSNSEEVLNPYRLKGRENQSSRTAKNSYLGNRHDYEYYRHLKKVYSFWNVLLPSISPPILQFNPTNTSVERSGREIDVYDIKYRHAFFSMLTVVCLLLAILGVCVYILNKNRNNFDTSL